MYSYPSNSEIIKQHKTRVNQNNEYREYVVYKKDEVFITASIDWKIKSETKSGGNLDYYEEFKNEKDALIKYKEILSAWESEN